MQEWRAGGAETADQSCEAPTETSGDSCCSSSKSACGSQSGEPSR
jgi:hypothetical protein